MTVTDAEVDRMVWARREMWLQDARDHLHRFGPAVVRDAAGDPLEYSLLHLSWIAHLNYCWSHNLHAGIFTTSGASGFLVTLAAWLTGKNPAERVKVVCASDNQARLCMRAVRGIMKSRAYEMIFPEMEHGARWDDRQMVYERPGQVSDPVIEARGVSTKPAGTTATRLLFNAAVDAYSASSLERRTAHKGLVDDLWMSRLTPGGRVLWIAAPINPDDTSYAMRAREDFCWLEQRVRGDASGYEQEVYGAGADYVVETKKDLVTMMGAATG